MGFSGSGRVTGGARPFHPRMFRKTHSFVSVSLPLPLRTSDTITCHFVAFLILRALSLGRKMGFSGSGRVKDGARPFHPRMVIKTHSFVSVSLPPPLRTSSTITCHFCCTFDTSAPSLGRKMGFSGSGRVTDGARPFHPRMVRNGRRAAVSPLYVQKNSQLCFRFTPLTPAHLQRHHLPLLLHF